MTSSRASCDGPLVARARPTASTAAIWRARRRWSAGRGDGLGDGSLHLSDRAPGTDGQHEHRDRQRDATVEPAGSHCRDGDDRDEERGHRRGAEDGGLARAEDGGQRHDREVQARERGGRQVVRSEAHPQHDPQRAEQAGGVEGRGSPAVPAYGKGDLDRQEHRQGQDEPEGVGARDQLDDERGEDHGEREHHVRVRGDAGQAGIRGQAAEDGGHWRDCAVREGHRRPHDGGIPHHTSGEGRAGYSGSVSATGAWRLRRRRSRGCRPARTRRSARWPAGWSPCAGS